MSSEKITVNCPHCQKTILWKKENHYRPFCSKRCQLIDLGEWSEEEKRIPGDSVDLNTESDNSTENYFLL